MGLTCLNYKPSSYNMEEPEIEVEIEIEQEVRAAEENGVFRECAPGFLDNLEYQGILNQQGDMNPVVNLNYPGGDVAFSSQGSGPSPRPLQLEGWGTSAARVPQPQPRRTRPRIRRGLTAWQLSDLESVFQEVQYPDVIMKKKLARRLYMLESEVHRWFKIRRAKYRKNQSLQMPKCTPEGTQNIFD
ncbi:rhox homeobox family member 1-like [Mastomys coucha]|uniref:rhox homeobox family member 1-like n=1 Tax=Mastomys coucha TaxID=35658 RepID=UPI0012616F8E|nr:rhox homeobox family member 1-like [Mastomys coucha]